MKSGRFSRLLNLARFAVSAELFFTRTQFNGSAKNHLKASASSMRIWFPFARINFMGRKARGLLYIKSPLHPDPILFGGGHENERRAGTENLAGIMGLVEALERFVKSPVFDTAKLKPLATKLAAAIENIDGCELVSPRKNCLANTISFIVRGADSISLLAGLDMEGICASSGSACSAGSLEPSHVIVALWKLNSANSLVRFSLGRASTMVEVDFVCEMLPEIIRRAQLGR